MVTPGKSAADIGTDHGYVPIRLVRDGISPRCLAMDINRGPLERAANHIRREGLTDKIPCRLSDGLAAYEKQECGCVIISGMGGELIISILERGREKLGDAELVLCPHTHVKDVRIYLRGIGYDIVREVMVYEDGKYYTVIKAAPASAAEGLAANAPVKGDTVGKEIYDLFGEYQIRHKDPVLIRYLADERNKYTDIRSGMAGSGMDAGDSRIEAVDAYLERIKEAEDEMQRNI